MDKPREIEATLGYQFGEADRKVIFIEKSAYLKLQEQNKILLEALTVAFMTIHDEFCGSTGHHPLCEKQRQALAKAGN